MPGLPFTTFALGLSGCIACGDLAAHAISGVEFHGSLHTQAEAVRPDRDLRKWSTMATTSSTSASTTSGKAT